MSIPAYEKVMVKQTGRFDASLHKTIVNEELGNDDGEEIQFSAISGHLPGPTLFLTRRFVNKNKSNVIYPYWNEGSEIRFFVRANPAIHRKSIVLQKKRDRVEAILDRSQQIEWLKNKLAQKGLFVTEAERIHQQETPSKVGLISINDVLFEVKGKVISEDGVIDLLNFGFGKHKRYGFGMIMPSEGLLYQFLQTIITQRLN